MRRAIVGAFLLVCSNAASAEGGPDVRVSCTSLRSNEGRSSACEIVMEMVFEANLREGWIGRFDPVIHFGPSASGAAFSQHAQGSTAYFREAFVERAIGDLSIVAGARKAEEPIAFDFLRLNPATKLDLRDPLQALVPERTFGIPGVYLRQAGNEWSSEVAIIQPPASPIPFAERDPWRMPLRPGLRWGNADEGGVGATYSVRKKYSDFTLAIMGGRVSANTVTSTNPDLATGLVRPVFARQSVFALAAEKQMGRTALRISAARHGQTAESYTRGAAELQYVKEWAGGGNFYASCGYLFVRQSNGSLLDFNRALANHGTCKLEYESVGRTALGLTLARGLHDQSGFAQAEIRVPISAFASTLRANDAQVSIRLFGIDGGNGSGVDTTFRAYGNRAGVFITLQTKY